MQQPAQNKVFYADTPDKISKVVQACYRAFERGETIGLDTEFYGVELGKQSCVARSKLHLLSIAVRRYPLQLAPRGYYVADAAVLPRAALEFNPLVFLLEGTNAKAVHNLPVDAHTLLNEGIRLNGGINTLAMARWAWPERARGAGFTLDALGEDIAGIGKTESFRDIFTESVTEHRITTRRETRCECGAIPCHTRSVTPGHARRQVEVETRHPRVVQREIPLESVGRGHPKWDRVLAYSARDAVLALAVYDLAKLEMERAYRTMHW